MGRTAGFIFERRTVRPLQRFAVVQVDASRAFFFNDTATPEIYTLSLHDALPISTGLAAGSLATGLGSSGADIPTPAASTPAVTTTRANSFAYVTTIGRGSRGTRARIAAGGGPVASARAAATNSGGRATAASPAAGSETPRRVSRARNVCRAAASRDRTVPSGRPRARAASSFVRPSR